MNILLTLSDIINIDFCYTYYMEKQTESQLNADTKRLHWETQQLLKTSMKESFLGAPTAFTHAPITVTPAQWRTLREAVSQEIPHEPFNPITLSSQAPAAYCAILQKLNTYELAAHVEEAFTDEPLSETL